MKIKTEQEIEEIADIELCHQWGNHGRIPRDGVRSLLIYVMGKFQKDLLEGASEGLEEWHQSEVDKLTGRKTSQGDLALDAVIALTTLESLKDDLLRLWQASRLSMMKENEKLQAKISTLELNLLASERRESELKDRLINQLKLQDVEGA